MAGVTPRRLRRDMSVVVLCAVIAVAASYLYGRTLEPQYRSVARMLVTPDNAQYQGRDLLTALDTLARTSVMPTYVEVLNSARVRQSAATSLGYPPGTLSDYGVEAVALPEANIIEVTSEGPDPERVAALTDAIVAEGAAYLGARYAMYEIEVLDEAVAADQPFAPNPPRDAILAGVLGAGLGVAIVLGLAGLQAAIHAPSPVATSRSSAHRKAASARK